MCLEDVWSIEIVIINWKHELLEKKWWIFRKFEGDHRKIAVDTTRKIEDQSKCSSYCAPPYSLLLIQKQGFDIHERI